MFGGGFLGALFWAGKKGLFEPETFDMTCHDDVACAGSRTREAHIQLRIDSRSRKALTHYHTA